MTENNFVTHFGGCHCRKVRFKVKAADILSVVHCDCSICQMKQNHHFIVPEENFELLQGEDYLTEYRFNTMQAVHLFCKICGVQSFYKPRSNPDGYGVMPHCLDPGTVKDVIVEKFHGQSWEKSMKDDDLNLSSRSKASN